MPATEEALALRRKRNREAQAHYQARYFGERPSLSRLRADISLEVRRAFERLAAHRALTGTALVENLVLAADRRAMRRLRGEALARYCAGGELDVGIAESRRGSG